MKSSVKNEILTAHQYIKFLLNNYWGKNVMIINCCNNCFFTEPKLT